MRGLLVLALVASACTGSSTPRPSPVNSPSERGGTLRVVEPGADALPLPILNAALNEDFDPQRSYWGTAWELFRCCLLRTLMSYDVDPANRTGRIVVRPDLADGEPVVSDDALTWTFHIKPGLHYGPPLEDVPIVATDFVRALERSGNTQTAPPKYWPYFYFSVIRGFDEYRAGKADSIAGLETPDDLTLVVHLTRPAGDLPHLLALPGSAPIPPNPVDAQATFGVATGHDLYGQFLVSSGPYMLEGSEDLDFSVPPSEQEPVDGFVPGESVTLVRNPSWHRDTDPLRPAFVDQIEVRIGGSREQASRAVVSGRADALFESLALDDTQLRALRNAGLQDQIHFYDGVFTIFISLNVAEPPFDDIHVRKAVNYVIDKRRLMSLAPRFEGSFVPAAVAVATHLVPDILENQLLLGYDYYRTRGGRGDLELARAEMALSRYDSDGDGICDRSACADIVAPTIPYFVGPAAAALAARNMQEIGLQVRPKIVTFSQGGKLIQDPTSRTPMYIGRGWQSDFPNGSTFFVPLLSSWGSFNSSLVGATRRQLLAWGYPVSDVPSLDARIKECEAHTSAEQVECWARLDKYLTEQVVPAVPLIWGRSAIIVSERVTRYSFDPLTLTPALEQIALESGSS